MFKRIVLFVLCMFFICSLCFAETVVLTISSTPGAGGSWSGGIFCGGGDSTSRIGQAGNGFLNISVYGSSWSGTVTLQRLCHDTAGNLTWCDVKTYTSNSQKALLDYQKFSRYRIGMYQADYTSGSVRVELTNAGGW